MKMNAELRNPTPIQFLAPSGASASGAELASSKKHSKSQIKSHRDERDRAAEQRMQARQRPGNEPAGNEDRKQPAEDHEKITTPIRTIVPAAIAAAYQRSLPD